jgi:hypothetical protein
MYLIKMIFKNLRLKRKEITPSKNPELDRFLFWENRY